MKKFNNKQTFFKLVRYISELPNDARMKEGIKPGAIAPTGSSES